MMKKQYLISLLSLIAFIIPLGNSLSKITYLSKTTILEKDFSNSNFNNNNDINIDKNINNYLDSSIKQFSINDYYNVSTFKNIDIEKFYTWEHNNENKFEFNEEIDYYKTKLIHKTFYKEEDLIINKNLIFEKIEKFNNSNNITTLIQKMCVDFFTKETKISNFESDDIAQEVPDIEIINSSVSHTTLTIDYESNPGPDEYGDTYLLTKLEVEDSKNNSLYEIKNSNGLELNGSIVVKKLKSNTKYDGCEMKATFSVESDPNETISIISKPPIIVPIDSFETSLALIFFIGIIIGSIADIIIFIIIIILLIKWYKPKIVHDY